MQTLSSEEILNTIKAQLKSEKESRRASDLELLASSRRDLCRAKQKLQVNLMKKESDIINQKIALFVKMTGIDLNKDIVHIGKQNECVRIMQNPVQFYPDSNADLLDYAHTIDRAHGSPPSGLAKLFEFLHANGLTLVFETWLPTKDLVETGRPPRATLMDHQTYGSNPHLLAYGCYGGSGPLITQAVHDGNIAQAITIVKTMGLNKQDSAVASWYAREVETGRSYITKRVCKELPFTYHDWITTENKNSLLHTGTLEITDLTPDQYEPDALMEGSAINVAIPTTNTVELMDNEWRVEPQPQHLSVVERLARMGIVAHQ